MKTYETSHPWITFRYNLEKLGLPFWSMLGELQSKCEHISNVPMTPSVAMKLHNLYLAKGVLATTAIEGNTLTEAQVIERINGEKNLPRSKEYLGIEVDNIAKACNNIVANRGLPGFDLITVREIKDFNKAILEKLESAEHVVPGEIRSVDVGVGSYRGAPPEDCEFLLERLCQSLNEDFIPPKGFEEYKMGFAVIKAVMAHLYLAWIHPFGDGNGRTARLVEFKILFSSGVPSAASHLLSNFYNETRSKYYSELDYASKSNGDISKFLNYAVQGFVDGLKEQLKTIFEHQVNVHWISHVHETFRGKETITDKRLRDLALDLSTENIPVPATKLRVLSARIIDYYKGKSQRTFLRDIQKLEEMGLVNRDGELLSANKKLVLAFRPVSVGM